QGLVGDRIVHTQGLGEQQGTQGVLLVLGLTLAGMSPSGVEDLLVELLDPAPGGHAPTPGPHEGADHGVENCLLAGLLFRPAPWLCTHPGSWPLRRSPLDTGSFSKDGTVREGSFSSKDPVCFAKPRQQRP